VSNRGRKGIGELRKPAEKARKAEKRSADRAEELRTLRLQVSLLRTMIDNIPGCHIFAKDRESRFITTNAYHLNALGRKRVADVVGKTDFDFFPRDLARQYYEDEQKVISSGVALVDREEMVVGPDGAESWFLTTKIPVRDADGRISGIVGLSRDITERKRVEVEQRRLLAEVQEALQNIKTLRGLIPICASCKRIRDDTGYWHRVEEYVVKHSEAQFSHGICPECTNKLYPELGAKVRARLAKGKTKQPPPFTGRPSSTSPQ
jgi:PAS domain S-box-containing protein